MRVSGMRPPIRLFAQNQYLQLVTYAFLTAFFIVIGNKILGNGTITISWTPPVAQTVSII